MTKLTTADILNCRELVTIQGKPVQIPDAGRLVHLQFRRYAGGRRSSSSTPAGASWRPHTART